MRKVAFVVFNNENAIVDRFSLDIITDIQGVGFKLKLSTIDGDIESIVTKVVQDKQDVKFKIHFINHPYAKSTIIEQWIEKYSTPGKRLALEYSDGMKTRYTEGKIIELSKTEKDEFNRLIRDCVFKPLTPFFTHVSNAIKIKMTSYGKSYPYKYPYSYGAAKMENNEINNPYILDVPVTVKITGSVSEPIVRLLDENNVEYNRVSFPEVTLYDGDYIIINSADRKIWANISGAGEQDFAAHTDPSYDTFLRAITGKSKISVNFSPSDTGELVGSWRQYGL